MVDTRQFNSLPLLSAKHGLDSSLAAAGSALEAYFSAGMADTQKLQEALAELHRVSGVLQILSLDGLVVFCHEFETVLNEMKAQEQVPSSMQREVVLGAMQALSHYLDGLANGASNAALRLFYTYQELHQLRGLESAFEVDLFFPDLDVTLPPEVLAMPPGSDAQANIKAARAQYQQSLLKWLRQDNAAEALRTMRAAVESVMNNIPQNHERAFWWVATGLLDCLIHDGLPLELSAKKLLGRVDLQMKSLADHGNVDNQATLCEMLYMIARSHPVSNIVESIKQLYELSSYLPQAPLLPPGETAPVLEQMRQQLNAAQEALEAIVQGDETSSQKLVEHLEQLYAQSEQLDPNTLQFLCKQLYSTVSNPDVPDAVHRVMNDMTMAMLVLGNGIEHYLILGNNFHEQVRIIGQRLQAALELTPQGEDSMASLISLHCQGAEHEVLIPLAIEMKNNMQNVEQTLSMFFKDTGKRAELASLRKQLSQTHGGLYILALETPAKLMNSLLQAIERFISGGNPAATEMRDIAAAVSALDAYLRDLAQGQKTDSSAMEELVNALQAEYVPQEIAEVQSATEQPSGVSVREGGEDDELLEVFLEEAQEVLETLHTNLLECQNNIDNREALITIRRGFHTLKGSGRMVGLTNLGEVAWAVERAMNKWMQDEKPATPALLEMIGDAEVLFEHWVDRLRTGASAMIDTVGLLAAAQRVENGEIDAPPVQQIPAVKEEVPAIQDVRELPEIALQLVPEQEPISESQPESELAFEPQGVMIGNVSVSPGLFNIATEEAATNIEILQRLAAEMRSAEAPLVSYDLMRAAHTLAGVNRAMGITQIGELASALDQWLQIHLDSVKALDREQFELLDQCITSLDAMSQALRGMQEPESQPELIARLQETKSPEAALPHEIVGGELEHASLVLGETQGEENTSLNLPEITQVVPTSEPMLSGSETELNLPEFELPADLTEQANVVVQEEPASLELLLAGDKVEQESHAEFNTEAAEAITPTESISELTEPDGNLVSYAEYQAQQMAQAATEQQPEVAAGANESVVAEVENLDELIAVAHAEDELLRAQAIAKQRTVHDDLDEQLLPIFLEEADELYPQISNEMRTWREQPESSPEGIQSARKLQRSLHTLKGSARMAGAMRLGELTHRVEDCLEKALASDRQDAALMDELDNYFDRIANALEQLRKGEAVEVAEPEAKVTVAAAQVEKIMVTPAHTAEPVQQDKKVAQAVPPEHQPEAGDERGAAAMLRVRSDIVDDLVNEAGEISVARSRIEIELRGFKDGLLELTDSVNHLRKLVREIEIHAEGQMQARVTVAGDSAEKFDPLEFDRFTRFQELTRFMNESVHDVQTVQQTLLKNIDEASSAMSAQAHLNRELQQSLMSIRMLPFSSISQRLYRIVRQTGKELNKKVNLELRGTEVELDRGVLEKMTAPFEHLLRNSIVHGLEEPVQREARGKPPLGNITLSLRQEGNEVIFEFTDDGAGLNLPKLRQKGLENGLLPQGEASSDDQVMKLIFATGLSTASELTEISGRGVGMDVVRSEITGLGGRIDVFSEANKGTRFVIYLPLTLAVMKTLTVRAVQQIYAIPSVMVEQVQQVKPAALEALYREGKVEWQDKVYPLHYLASLLGNYEHMPEIKPYNAVLLLRSGEQRMALHLDELLGNREVVVKNIGTQLARLPGIAGATVLGDGKVVLILNPVQLLQQVEKVPEAKVFAPVVEPVRQVPIVMIVDDSLTVRKITTRLLTRAGYEVVTAKDGVDALEQLVDMTPDLMLLDVEMPRMDGFELTKQLRRDIKTLHMPIIMITSRTADKHKNYALELGVDEYLGKPYQEDELLSNIERLLSIRAAA